MTQSNSVKLLPELLAPAGDMASLVTAVECGADSVYFGVKSLNMRNTAGNFELNELSKVMTYLHERSVKGYLTLNTIIYNSEIDTVRKILTAAKNADVDAVICWDMSVLSEASRLGIPIHLSTQASVSNSTSFEYYAKLGVSRIVLARECSLKDIAEIAKFAKSNGIKCEIEAFVHGAMCVSESGRCFMSTNTFNKSANRGQCVQPCRREYLITDLEDKENSYILGRDYVLSPKDLCMIEHLDSLISAGVGALKIEGRNRSPDYVKTAVTCYRRALDSYLSGSYGADPSFYAGLKEELSKVYNRGFSTGFYLGMDYDWISEGPQAKEKKVFCGEVVNYYNKINVAEFLIRGESLNIGDRILVYGKNTPAKYEVVNEIQVEHKSVNSVSRGERCGVKLSFSARPKDKLFVILDD